MYDLPYHAIKWIDVRQFLLADGDQPVPALLALVSANRVKWVILFFSGTARIVAFKRPELLRVLRAKRYHDRIPYAYGKSATRVVDFRYRIFRHTRQKWQPGNRLILVNKNRHIKAIGELSRLPIKPTKAALEWHSRHSVYSRLQS